MNLGKIVRTVSLCGSEKCCPTVRLYGETGVALVKDDGDGTGTVIHLTAEQARALRDLLNKEYPK